MPRGLQGEGALQLGAMAALVLAATAAQTRLMIAQPGQQRVSKELLRLLQRFDLMRRDTSGAYGV